MRGYDGRQFNLANPAFTWKGVGDELDAAEWNAWGRLERGHGRRVPVIANSDMLMQALFLLLQDNPAAVTGFVGGVVGAILVHVVHWRWQVIRRKHPTAE